MEGGLWAWEALQGTLKMAAEDSDLLTVWARIKCQDIDSNEGRNFILGDGHIHFLNIIKTVESLEWRLLPLRR
jgi:hypothetical protein